MGECQSIEDVEESNHKKIDKKKRPSSRVINLDDLKLDNKTPLILIIENGSVSISTENSKKKDTPKHGISPEKKKEGKKQVTTERPPDFNHYEPTPIKKGEFAYVNGGR